MEYPAHNEMMTGREYLDSLNDGREVYIYGERVENVCEHRALRNSATPCPGFTMPCMILPARRS